MTVAQILSLLSIFIVIFSFTREKADYLSPARIFTLIWGIMIFLAEFKFSKYQSIWSGYGWFVLISGLFSFLLGVFISYTMNLSRPQLSIQEIKEKISSTRTFDKLKFFSAFTFLFVSYLVCLFAEFIIEGYIPIFSDKPDISRMEFGVFGLHLLVNQMPVILLLGVEFLVIKPKGKGIKIITLLFMAITFVTYFTILVRFNYIYWILTSFALLYYATSFINWKRVLISFAGFIGFFYLLMTIRLSQYAAQFLYITSKMKYSAKYAEFTGIYMYLVMNLENLARLADKIEYHLYSVMTFDWIYAITGLKHWIKDYVNYDPRPMIISGYNTFPFLMEYFYDFGLLGVMIFPLLTGLIISTFYYRMRTSGSLEGIIYYAFCFFLIVISFFTNPLTMLSIVSNIIVIWFIHRFFLYKEIPQLSAGLRKDLSA
jgi:oligosaccharide repeat unit polymerase